jgi:hypothetical protein
VLRLLLDAIDGLPAYGIGRWADILAWKDMAAAFFGDWSRLRVPERNWARMVFLQPEYRDLFVDWEQKQIDAVSALRMEAGCHPDDRGLSDLVGELSVRTIVRFLGQAASSRPASDLNPTWFPEPTTEC